MNVQILPDLVIPGAGLLIFAADHPLAMLGIVFGIAAVTVLLITLLKRKKGEK